MGTTTELGQAGWLEPPNLRRRSRAVLVVVPGVPFKDVAEPIESLGFERDRLRRSGCRVRMATWFTPTAAIQFEFDPFTALCSLLVTGPNSDLVRTQVAQCVPVMMAKDIFSLLASSNKNRVLLGLAAVRKRAVPPLAAQLKQLANHPDDVVSLYSKLTYEEMCHGAPTKLRVRKEHLRAWIRRCQARLRALVVEGAVVAETNDVVLVS